LENFVLNNEGYQAVHYLPLLYSENMVAMVRMIRQREKSLFELIRTFDQYVWLAMLLALLIFGVYFCIKFKIELKKSKKNLNIREFILIDLKLTTSLLETLANQVM
jgi:hypothetical protein